MSEHMFFQGNPSGKADDAPSELSTLSVLCELLGNADALERRIAKLENDQMLTMQTSPKKMPLQVAISYLEGMAHVAQRRVRDLDALEQRIEKLERKLNHTGGDE